MTAMHREAPRPKKFISFQCEDSVPSVIEPNREIAMGRDRVSKQTKQFLEQYHGGFELVGDAQEPHLLAGLNEHPSKLKWRRRYNIDVRAIRVSVAPTVGSKCVVLAGSTSTVMTSLSATLPAGFNEVVAGRRCLSPVPQHRQRPSCTWRKDGANTSADPTVWRSSGRRGRSGSDRRR